MPKLLVPCGFLSSSRVSMRASSSTLTSSRTAQGANFVLCRRDANFKAEPREILIKHEAINQPATGPRYGLTMHEQARLGQDR